MAAKRRVLVVTTEALPGWGAPCAGGGIRAHSLGEALRDAGHEVIYSVPQALAAKVEIPREAAESTHEPYRIAETIHRLAPDVAVFEQWQPLTFLEPVDCPVVVDLPGPLILEYAFRGGRALHVEASSKLRALAKADLYLYSNPNQKAYWLPWTVLAGASPETDWLAHVPICRSPALPEPPETPREMRFIYGGIFWPWQEPTLALNTLIEQLEERREGRLDIYGGTHPHHEVKNEVYYAPEKVLRKSERVAIHSMMPLADLEREYTRGGFALELTARNPEREIASTIRTIGYLWCGLPVVVNHYSYLAPLVESYNAGWVSDPDDPKALRETFSAIFAERDDFAAKSRSAQRMVREHFTWDRAARPLVEFCENPRVRPKAACYTEHLGRYVTKLESEIDRLEDSEKFLQERAERAERLLHEREFELYQLRSKLSYRIFKRIQRLFAPRD